jgi:hypothetical protein
MFAAQKSIQFANGKSGVAIVNEKSSGIVLDWAINEMTISDITNKGGNFTGLSVNGFIGTGEEGLPELPYNGKIIAVPVNAVLSVNFVNTHSTVIDLKAHGFNQVITPAQPSVEKCKDAKDMPFVMNQAAYQQANYRSFVPVQIEEIGFMRGYRLVTVSYTPVEYNPVNNTAKVYDKVRVEIGYEGADYAQTEYMRAKTYSPAFESTLAKSVLNYVTPNTRDTLTRYPMKYVIIADPMFTAQLTPFIEWKTQQGYQVIVQYKGDAAVGSTKESIKAYLQGLWNAATPTDPAPTYLLFVADHGQIPAWNAQASPNGHITDLTYVRLEGTDFLPELYYGRFSANNVNELQPQIDKTLYYEKYQFADPTYLGNQILIAGVDGTYGPRHANGQINYITTHYATAANGVTPLVHLYPNSGSQDAAIVAETSQGAGWINYTAHGSETSWADPSFTISNINSLQNSGKYPFVIGNCCLTNKFEVTTCFGEAWLRAADKGAIIYIGGTNSTYWDEDYWFAVGLRPATSINGTASPYDPNHLGMYDQAYHTHGEAYADWNVTAMGMVHAGNMVVQASSSSKKNYYWEIYSVMGDPSLVPYLKQGMPNPAEYMTTMFIGMTTYTITSAAPYSYAAITFNGELKGYALCDENGEAVINLDPITVPGNAKLVISAQNYIPVMADIQVVPNDGAYIVFDDMTVATSGNNSLDYNSSSALTVDINNVGSETAQNLNVVLRSLNPYITVTDSTETVDAVVANQIYSLVNAFSVTAAENCPDTEQALMQLIITDGQEHSWTTSFRITLNAPVIATGAMSINDSQGNNNGRLDPGETIILSIPIQNTGHAVSANGLVNYASTNPQVVIENTNNNLNALGVNESVNLDLTITASAELPTGSSTNIGIFTQFGQIINQSSYFLAVGLKIESFESGDFTAYPWTHSTTQWTIVNVDAFDGTYAAKSTNTANSSSSFISVVDTASTAGVIKFAYKVSSEASYDKLKFYIDGVEKNAWSGDVPWTEAEYNVTAGVHTYKWEYSKDISVNSGSDCAWVDKIIFPNAGGGSNNTAIAYMNTDPIDFGTVEPNETAVKNIVVVNFGLLPLSGELTVPTPYSVESANFVVEAESNLTIPVTYSPTSEGTHSGQITVATNDTTHPSFVIEITGTCGTNSSDSVLPKVTKLQGNYPNPFNPVTNISFSLKENSPVTIDIYNVKGQLVKQLVNEAMQAGNHTVVWNGKDQNNKSVSSGVYFYRMQSKNYAGTKKMLLMK